VPEPSVLTTSKRRAAYLRRSTNGSKPVNRHDFRCGGQPGRVRIQAPITPAVLALEVRHAPDDLSGVRTSDPVLWNELRSLRRTRTGVCRLRGHRKVPRLRVWRSLGTGLRDLPRNAPLPDLRGPQARLAQNWDVRAETITATGRRPFTHSSRVSTPPDPPSGEGCCAVYHPGARCTSRGPGRSIGHCCGPRRSGPWCALPRSSPASFRSSNCP